MNDSCNATQITNKYSVNVENSDVETHFNEILEKFARSRDLTIEEAREHLIMKETYKSLVERAKGR